MGAKFRMRIVHRDVVVKRWTHILKVPGILNAKSKGQSEAMTRFFKRERILEVGAFFQKCLVDDWISYCKVLDIALGFNVSKFDPWGKLINHAKLVQDIVECSMLQVSALLPCEGDTQLEHSNRTRWVVQKAYCILVCLTCVTREARARESGFSGCTETTSRQFFGCSACFPFHEWNPRGIVRLGQPTIPLYKIIFADHVAEVVDVLLGHYLYITRTYMDKIWYEREVETDYRLARKTQVEFEELLHELPQVKTQEDEAQELLLKNLEEKTFSQEELTQLDDILKEFQQLK